MHGDFSRLTFDPAKRFSAVLSLQGRVLVDADANESAHILQHYLRTLATDLLGEFSVPKAAPGFQIAAVEESGRLTDLGIGFGRCYVDGVLVENPTKIQATSFYRQPDAYFSRDADPFPTDRPFFVYLQIWERLVTCVEDPSIRDVALGAGGPDSSGRAKVVWQVRCGAPELDGAPPTTAEAAVALWEKTLKAELAARSTGMLSASHTPTEDDGLCALAPEAGYRGLENQLYRVEVHRGGVLAGKDDVGVGDPPTFKWSRDNGVALASVDSLEGKLVTVATLGRDDRFQIGVRDWVEVVDDARALSGVAAPLHRVEDVDLGERRITLDAIPADGTGTDPSRHPFLRRWDQQESPRVTLGADHAITAVAGTSLPLEDGVEVTFAPGTYRTGDYWLIPARVETGKVEWPVDDHDVAIALPPRGIRYHYAPLAFVNARTSPTSVLDLRPGR
jgi:hypothetical protein